MAPRRDRCRERRRQLTPAKRRPDNLTLPSSTAPSSEVPRMNVSHKLGLSLVAAALLTVYGCSNKEEPKTAAVAPAPADDSATVTIGSAGPLTGGIAHLGKDNDNGVHLAIDQANDKKLKIGGKTIKFVVDSEDDQADPKLGPTIAQKFADAKVAGVGEFLRDCRPELRVGLVVFAIDDELDRLAADLELLVVGLVDRQVDAVVVVLAEVRDAAGERAGAADRDGGRVVGGRRCDGGRLGLFLVAAAINSEERGCDERQAELV